MSLWLNVDEQRIDWIEKLDSTTFQHSITVDESYKRQVLTSHGCPVLELRKIGDSSFKSAFIASKDCESKAKVLCTLDLSKPTKVEKQPNLSCLQAKEMTSKTGEKASLRRKRDTHVKMDEQIEIRKNGKILVNMLHICEILETY